MKTSPLWVVAILFTGAGFVLPAAGLFLHPLFVLLGLPLSLLGWLLLGALFYGENLRRGNSDRYPAWHWWTNLVGGMVTGLALAVPALFAFPVLLLMGMRQHLLLGALLTVLGLGIGLATLLLAAQTVRNRPPVFERPQVPGSEWETDEYRRWIQGGGEDPLTGGASRADEP